MESALDRELSRAKRYGGSLSVVFIDLDDFKKINDTLGHDCGDELLVSAASAMLGMVRLNDIVSRFAGDEFVIILPQTSPKEAENLLKRMVRHFEENPARLRGTPVTVRFSYGIASPDLSGDEDAASLLKKADDRLYQHKRSRSGGRGVRAEAPACGWSPAGALPGSLGTEKGPSSDLPCQTGISRCRSRRVVPVPFARILSLGRYTVKVEPWPGLL